MIIQLDPGYKRNRKQRQSTTMYRVDSLVRNEPQSKLVEGQSCAIEGEIGDYVIVSVPPTISYQAAKVLEDNLQKELDKPVMILTHNVQFLKATKLAANEAAAILKEVEDSIVEQDAPEQDLESKET